MDKTVAQALALLEHLARAQTPMKPSILARELDSSRATVRRLLALLQDAGYLEREAETGRYQPSLRVWEVARQVIAAHPVRRAVTPYAHDLHRVTGETITVGVLDGDDALIVHKLLAARPLRFISREGSRFPAAFNPSGLVMLAHEPDAAAVIDRALAAKAESPVTREELLAKLEVIRRRGYDVAHSNLIPGLTGLAVALGTRDGFSRAFVMISGDSDKIAPRQQELATELMGLSARIATECGRL